MKRILIHHPNFGVFLGEGLGLAFWSRLDPCYQDAAVTFEDMAKAKEYVATWPTAPFIAQLTYVVVETAQPTWATIDECEAAGVARWLPDMPSVAAFDARVQLVNYSPDFDKQMGRVSSARVVSDTLGYAITVKLDNGQTIECLAEQLKRIDEDGGLVGTDVSAAELVKAGIIDEPAKA